MCKLLLAFEMLLQSVFKQILEISILGSSFESERFITEQKLKGPVVDSLYHFDHIVTLLKQSLESYLLKVMD